ncbi:hypothetical protein RhiirA1_481883 [Rhizophagus irregularis]|uniref:ATP-dependent DNA helicase n=1 Tax=Rhizophagus irregularis TaxID=588596 RepID=A0A2N0QMJ5_9GLOM|nr:hypothetical protein RhiirA1_481883 [Rhizophagus irregularis]
MIIFRRIETHYNAIITNHNQVEPLRLIIMGTAETSKSYLINAIRACLQEIAINNGAETSPVIVLAPTGIAAFNIHGTMIHSTLSILINSSDLSIEAFPEHQNQPFCGRSVILVGDFGQLPLIIDEPIYSKKPRHDSLSNDENNQFMDEIHITPQKVDVYEINLAKLKSLNAPVARVHAVHTGGNDASKADSDTAKGLEAQLLLSKGARVMLKANLSVETGLANGSVGTIDDIYLLFQLLFL